MWQWKNDLLCLGIRGRRIFLSLSLYFRFPYFEISKMYTIHIRVQEGNKEAFLQSLDGLRKTLDFEFQQRKTEPASDRESKEENHTESQRGKLLSATSTSSVVIELSDAEVTERRSFPI